MPLAKFTTNFKPKSFSDYPKFKLNAGEKARVAVMPGVPPTYLWVHTFQAPLIVNGVVQTETKKRGENEYEDYKYDFMGYRRCTGDEGIIEDIGLDVKNCIICKAAKDLEIVESPVRRYAMNLIRYNTKPGTDQPSSPFGVTLEVWVFSEKVWGQLWDLADNPEDGPIDTYDLRIECKSGRFAQYEIKSSNKTPVWQTNAKTKEITKETYENQKQTDLESIIARTSETKFIRQDLETIKSRWDTVNGKESADTKLDEDELAGLTEGLDLLSTDSDNDEPDFNIFADDDVVSSANGSTEDADSFDSLAEEFGLK